MNLSTHELKDLLKLAGIGHQPKEVAPAADIDPIEASITLFNKQVESLADNAVENTLLLDTDNLSMEEPIEEAPLGDQVTDVTASDYFPTGEHGPVFGKYGPSAAKHGNNPLGSDMSISESTDTFLGKLGFSYDHAAGSSLGSRFGSDAVSFVNDAGFKIIMSYDEESKTYTVAMYDNEQYSGEFTAYTPQEIESILSEELGVMESSEVENFEASTDAPDELLESYYVASYKKFIVEKK